MITRNGRPVYLNLIKIKLPITGMISIFHRIFGLLLAFAIPFFTLLFGLSLQSEEGFNQAVSMMQSVWLQPLFLLLIWGFVHHFLAGIRYLLLDLEIGVEKKAATRNAQIVMYLGLFITVLLALRIWL